MVAMTESTTYGDYVPLEKPHAAPPKDDAGRCQLVTGIQGLDDLQNPVIRPFFNLTIHVHNEKNRRPACRPTSVVTMYHGDESLAWGEVPAFCVEKRSAVDLDVSLSSKGAILSAKLRDKMV
ncbi:hypothetical protein EJB05_23524, partial [Eragrostis curvula]